MATITRSRTIPSEPKAVWEVLVDYGAIAEWADFVEHSSMLRAGPLEVGSTRRIQMGSSVVLERVVAVDPPTGLEYQIEGLPRVVSSVRNRWELAPTAAGGTEVSLTTTVTVGSRPPQKLAERVLGRVLASRSDAMLEGLAVHLEHQHD